MGIVPLQGLADDPANHPIPRGKWISNGERVLNDKRTGAMLLQSGRHRDSRMAEGSARPAAYFCGAGPFGGGGELEQIQFPLGHRSVETTKRYLGIAAKIGSGSQRSPRSRTTGWLLVSHFTDNPTFKAVRFASSRLASAAQFKQSRFCVNRPDGLRMPPFLDRAEAFRF